MKDRDDSWSPRNLLGGVYCSPACGGGCTKAAYNTAVRNSNALAEQMGEGWEPVVWENLGWHYEVIKGVAAIMPPYKGGSGKYMVFFNTVPQIVTTAETPEDALGFAVQEARGNELRIATDCAALHQ